MNDVLSNKLSEQRRDALVAYVTNHVMQHKLKASSLNMINADHLFKYFLLDTQVSAQVKTSYLAEGLACVQQYINGALNNIELGFLGDFAPELLTFWQQAMAQYPLWAGYQMLEDYPENYIRADLRFDKSLPFQTLENDLSQKKPSEANIQTALLTYLKAYEYQNSISVVSGYIHYMGDQHDQGRFPGYAFTNSPCYLLGKNTLYPASYYWRKLDPHLDLLSTYIPPDAWGEWQEITMGDDIVMLDVRLVFFCGRLHVIYLHHGETIEEEGKEPYHWLQLDIAYLGLDKQWSASESLHKEKIILSSQKQNEPFRLLALAVAQPKGNDDKLAICLVQGEEEEAKVLFSVVRDVLKRESSILTPEALHTLLKMRFSDTDHVVKLQHRLTNEQLTVASITIDPVIRARENQYMWLEANYHFDSDNGNHQLMVRGHCEHLRVNSQLKSFYLTDHDSEVPNRGTVAVQGEDNYVEVYCIWPTKPARLTINLGADLITTFEGTDFSPNQFGWEEARKTITLTADQRKGLAKATYQERIDGAGFNYQVDDSNPQKLVSQKNQIISVQEPLIGHFSLLFKPAEGDTGYLFPCWEGDLPLNGGIATPWCTLTWEHDYGGGGGEVTFTFGEEGEEEEDIGRNSFTVALAPLYNNVPEIEKQSSGMQFLLFNNSEINIKPVRLNSQQIGDLINRAEASIWDVFSWEAQHQSEPAYHSQGNQIINAEDNPPTDFYGANSFYLYELFFYVPHLIASRLQDEGQFTQARRWLQLIFNPHQQVHASEVKNVAYWNCALLLVEDSPYSGVDHQLVDPHRIARSSPSYYRKAIFSQYINTLIDEADMYYRHLTRDSLAQAWQLYQMAADLMGEPLHSQTRDIWLPKRVDELLPTRQHQGLLLLTENSQIEPANLPKSLSTFFWAGVAQHPAFTVPVNQYLLDTWELLAQRFYNLRHYLTINGQPLQIPLFSPPIDPFALLLAQSGGNGGVLHLLGQQSAIPPYRYRTLMGKAQEVVATVIQFGDKLLHYMEQKDRVELDTLLYKQATEIGEYSRDIQKMLYNQQQETKKALEEQRQMVKERGEHYQQLADQFMSELEIAAQTVMATTSVVQGGMTAFLTASGLANSLPNIFGMANGGQQQGAIPDGAAKALGVAAAITDLSATQMTLNSQYQRRAQEWRLFGQQALREVAMIDKQLQAQQYAVEAAQASLKHSEKSLEQVRQVYQFYQDKSTNLSLYKWLRSQMASLYKTVFDQAVSLCKGVEACWEFEMGIFNSSNGISQIRPPSWKDDYYGFTAGESLLLDLQKLDAHYVQQRERREEVLRTLSLTELIKEGLVWDPEKLEPITSWEEAKTCLRSHGTLDFETTHKLFDLDYPGYYLRQIHSVEVSMATLLGPYKNVKAVLQQKSSVILTEADIEGVKYLYPDQGGSMDKLKYNLRVNQRMALSRAIQDSGTFSNPVIDDRYFSFENTGAISNWSIHFPNPNNQPQLIENLTDIIIDLRYRQRYGGQDFEEQVKGLLPIASEEQSDETE
jgi:hypothetical protein